MNNTWLVDGYTDAEAVHLNSMGQMIVLIVTCWSSLPTFGKVPTDNNLIAD